MGVINIMRGLRIQSKRLILPSFVPSVSVVDGEVVLTVSNTTTSSVTITGWLWTVRDGDDLTTTLASSTDRDPEPFEGLVADRFHITLQATSSQGSVETNREVNSIILPPPVTIDNVLGLDVTEAATTINNISGTFTAYTDPDASSIDILLGTTSNFAVGEEIDVYSITNDLVNPITTFAFTGSFTPDATYYVKAIARSAIGQTSTLTAGVSALIPSATVSAPTAFVVGNVAQLAPGSNRIPYTVAAADADSAQVWRSLNAGLTSPVLRGTLTGSQITVGAHNFDDLSAVGGVEYWYFITAINVGGSTDSNSDNITTASGTVGAFYETDFPIGMSATAPNGFRWVGYPKTNPLVTDDDWISRSNPNGTGSAMRISYGGIANQCLNGQQNLDHHFTMDNLSMSEVWIEQDMYFADGTEAYKTYTNCSMSAGSAVLNINAASPMLATNHDDEKVIEVPGAGPGGATLISRISTNGVVSATQVTLDHAASTPVAGKTVTLRPNRFEWRDKRLTSNYKSWTMTAGSNLLSIVGGVSTVTNGDVGSTITVPGAGPGAANLTTTIAARLNNSTAQLANAASTNASGTVAGGTNITFCSNNYLVSAMKWIALWSGNVNDYSKNYTTMVTHIIALNGANATLEADCGMSVAGISPNSHEDGAPGARVNNAITDGERGRWNQMRYHVKEAVSGNDGVAAIMLNGVVRLNKTNCFWAFSPPRTLRQGYLWGAKEVGFVHRTEMWLGAIRFYNTDPGWGI